jgi:hypothetical protein
MADDPNERGPADAMRVNVNQEHEVRYWTREFGCSERQLREAVEQVGVMAQAVRAAVSGGAR